MATVKETLITDCSDLAKEYWSHVSSQNELPIAEGAGALPLIADVSILAEAFRRCTSTDETLQLLTAKILERPELIDELRLLVCVSDKRLYLDLSYMFSRARHPSDYGSLCGCAPESLTRHSLAFFIAIVRRARQDALAASKAAQIIAQYFLEKGLNDILRLYASLAPTDQEVLVKTLIAPKEAQQNEAKRRGHGAEVEVASLLEKLGVRFKPEEKVRNPMGSYDPNVDLEQRVIVPREAGSTYSFDIVVVGPDDKVRVGFQGLVQSSDPGQFGVNKSDETVAVRRRLDVINAALSPVDHIEVWGILDGVGYSENKNGTINKLLLNCHTFIQMKSLYKVGLALHARRLATVKAISFGRDFYAETAIGHMSKYISPDIRVIRNANEIDPQWTAVPAGEAVLYI